MLHSGESPASHPVGPLVGESREAVGEGVGATGLDVGLRVGGSTGDNVGGS